MVHLWRLKKGEWTKLNIKDKSQGVVCNSYWCFSLLSDSYWKGRLYEVQFISHFSEYFPENSIGIIY